MQCYIKGVEAPGSYTTGQLENTEFIKDIWYMYSAKYKGPMHHIWVTTIYYNCTIDSL